MKRTPKTPVRIRTAAAKKAEVLSVDPGVDTVDTVADVIRRWNISEDTFYRMAGRGEIRLTRLGARRVGVRRSEQQRYLDAQTS